MEGLRKFPPLSQPRERVVPARSDTLGAYHVPAGKFVGLDTWERAAQQGRLQRRRSRVLSGAVADGRCGPAACHVPDSSADFWAWHDKCLGASMAVMEITKVVFELFRNFETTVGNPYHPWVSRCYGIFFRKGLRCG